MDRLYTLTYKIVFRVPPKPVLVILVLRKEQLQQLMCLAAWPFWVGKPFSLGWHMHSTHQPDLLEVMKWDHSAFKMTISLTFNHKYVHVVCVKTWCLHLHFWFTSFEQWLQKAYSTFVLYTNGDEKKAFIFRGFFTSLQVVAL